MRILEFRYRKRKTGMMATPDENLWATYAVIAQTGMNSETSLTLALRLVSSRLRAHVDTLVKLGLIQVGDGRVDLVDVDFAAIPGVPEPVVSALQGMRRSWLRWQEAGGDGVVLNGAGGFWTHWYGLLQRATSPMSVDVVIPDNPRFQMNVWLAEIDQDYAAELAEQAGMRMRFLVPPPDRVDTRALVSLVEPIGWPVRVRAAGEWFAVLGPDATVMPVHPDDAFDGPLRLSRRPEVARALTSRFDELWRASHPLTRERAPLSAGTERVLELLTEGLRDEELAQQLGVTERTVRARVAQAMADLDAHTRFQLGYRAARRP